MRVASAGLDGYLTGLKVDLVDQAGKVLSYRDVMLHHVVFANVLRRDTLCSNYTGFSGCALRLCSRAIFGVGEEGFALALPEGYGYPSRPQTSGAWSTC